MKHSPEAYIRAILEPICVEPEELKISVTQPEDHTEMLVIVSASTKDLPLIIGKGGITADSVRQLLTVWGRRNCVFVKFSIP
jgi:predicted RNA-binding protein YlqC (UPF0109 family)